MTEAPAQHASGGERGKVSVGADKVVGIHRGGGGRADVPSIQLLFIPSILSLFDVRSFCLAITLLCFSLGKVANFVK